MILIMGRDVSLLVRDAEDADAIVVLEVFQKKTQETPKYVIDISKRRIKQYVS